MPKDVDLILGTAQFGLDYGITNSDGRVGEEALDLILQQARERLHWLDTSIKYGNALSRLCRDSARPFAIVTKIDGADPAGISGEIDETLRELGRDRLDVVLFHTPAIFDDRVRASEAAAALQDEVSRGRVSRIGASLYDAREVGLALAAFTPQVLQMPASVADRRLLADGTAADLERAGIEVHYRSAFLQGLLLSTPERLAPQFGALVPLLVALDALAERLNVTRQALCMQWVMSMPAARGIVCGVAKPDELEALIAAHRTAAVRDNARDIAEIAGKVELDAALLDPRIWPKLDSAAKLTGRI